MIWPNTTAVSMPRKPSKLPVVGNNPIGPKVAVYLGPPNVEHRHMAWRFSNADIDGPFTCSQLDHEEHNCLWDRLRAFEKMNVAELRNDGSFHEIPIQKISPMARRRLRDIGLDDQETLYSFRMMAACRLWCMKHENLFSILWWDKHHQVYPTKK